MTTVVLGVFVSYLIIRVDLSFLYGLTLLIADLTVLFLLSIWKRGTVFTKLSKQAVATQKERDSSNYAKRIYSSCLPISISIGHYFQLTEPLILAIFATIIDYTIALLLTT